MVFVTHNQTSEILKPGKKTFDLPSALLAARLFSVLDALFTSVFSMRSNHFNASFVQKLLINSIAIVSLISDNAIRSILDKALVDGRFHHFKFVGRSVLDGSGDRRTSGVGDGHDLGAFAAFCLADSKNPF
jgi:hypothetical protein